MAAAAAAAFTNMNQDDDGRDDRDCCAIMVFSAPLTKQLCTNNVRLPPNYVGVRRVRPSNQMVRKAFVQQLQKQQQQQQDPFDQSNDVFRDPNSSTLQQQLLEHVPQKTKITKSSVVFRTIGEDGKERRMTHQEKKMLKYKIAQEKKEAKKQAKLNKKRKLNETTTSSINTDGIAGELSTGKVQQQQLQSQKKQKQIENLSSNNEQQILKKESIPIVSASKNSSSYHQLQVDEATLQQELAELAGVRNGVPPVVLSPPLAYQARRNSSFPNYDYTLPLKTTRMSDDRTCDTATIMTTVPDSTNTSSDEKNNGSNCNNKNQKPKINTTATGSSLGEFATAVIRYDEALSDHWAKKIKQSMVPAEKTREKEDMRPMAYQLTPEPWIRFRPTSLKSPIAVLESKMAATTTKAFAATTATTTITDSNSNKNSETDTIQELSLNEKNLEKDKNNKKNDNDSCSSTSKQQQQQQRLIVIPKKKIWAPVTIRQPRTTLDRDAYIIFELLYKQTNFHVSCGAKFGCDFLLYDGPREERHAFAGLRIIPSSTPRSNKKTATRRIEDEKADTTTTESLQENYNTHDGQKPFKAAKEDDITSLVVPTAYSLAGYVRCLNTAGKLALIATVLRDDDNDGSQNYGEIITEDDGAIGGKNDDTMTPAANDRTSKERREQTQSHQPAFRVAFVDLALEKILSAPTHRRRARTKVRKEIGLHLAKN